MIQTYDATDKNVPGYARHSSTFKTDKRCMEDAFVVGDDHDEVYSTTRGAWLELSKHTKKVTDYDVNWSTEGGMYVGVVAIDV